MEFFSDMFSSGRQRSVAQGVGNIHVHGGSRFSFFLNQSRRDAAVSAIKRADYPNRKVVVISDQVKDARVP